MSLLDRISPWQRSRERRASLAGETRATRDALAANIAGLARAMEERFLSIAERIDAVRAVQAAEAERLAEVLTGRFDGALSEFRVMLDARLDTVTAEIAAMRDSHDFARVLRELKRDLSAQLSLSSFEATAEIRAAAGLERTATSASGDRARSA